MKMGIPAMITRAIGVDNMMTTISNQTQCVAYVAVVLPTVVIMNRIITDRTTNDIIFLMNIIVCAYVLFLVSAPTRKKRSDGSLMNMIEGKTKHGLFRRETSTSSNIHGEIQSKNFQTYHITV